MTALETCGEREIARIRQSHGCVQGGKMEEREREAIVFVVVDSCAHVVCDIALGA